MDQFIEKTIQTEEIYNGKVVKLRVDEVTLPNGQTSKRELLTHQGAAAIIPVTQDHKIIFVRQYRKAVEKMLIEIPAGLIDQGERPEETAVRELEEETGYTTENLIFVTSFYPTPGYTDELIYIYFTKELEMLSEAKQNDEDELVELVELSLSEAKQYMKEQQIHDAKTNYAILYLESLGMK